eukprot:Nk52_evm16s224 gene=Nk52_evmTU16s224
MNSRVAFAAVAVLCMIALASAAGCVRHTGEKAKAQHAEGEAENVPSLPLEDLPANFDWSNVNGTNYLTQSWNQHIPTYCGSCWLHASTSVAQDRIKIAKKAMGIDVSLARQSLLNCGEKHGFGNGCHGGSPQAVFGFMHQIGLPDDTCQVYVAKEHTCDDKGMCMNCMPVGEDLDNPNCWAVKDYTNYKVKEYGQIKDNGQGIEAAIMSEVLARGPVVCGVITDENFDYNYTGGVWDTKMEKDEINHDIEVTGWGVTEDGQKFWNIRNSWGSYWGENGFAKILRDSNRLDHMKITDDCWFAVVDAEEENLLNNATLTGSMYGLRAQNDTKKAKIANDFARALKQQAEKNIASESGSVPVQESPAPSSSMMGYVFTAIAGLAAGVGCTALFMKRKSSQYEIIN